MDSSVNKQVSIGEVASLRDYGQTEGELRDIDALNGVLEQDVSVVRTFLLICSLLSGQTP